MQISRREVLFSQHKSLFPKVRHVFGAFTTRSSQRDLNTCPQIRKLLTRLQCPLVSRETSRERELGLLGFCAARLLRCSAMTANWKDSPQPFLNRRKPETPCRRSSRTSPSAKPACTRSCRHSHLLQILAAARARMDLDRRLLCHSGADQHV